MEGGKSPDSEQTEGLNDDTGSEDTSDYDSNEGGRAGRYGHVEFDLAEKEWWRTTCNLYGRKVEGTNADGSPKMGKWIHLISAPEEGGQDNHTAADRYTKYNQTALLYSIRKDYEGEILYP